MLILNLSDHRNVFITKSQRKKLKDLGVVRWCVVIKFQNDKSFQYTKSNKNDIPTFNINSTYLVQNTSKNMYQEYVAHAFR